MANAGALRNDTIDETFTLTTSRHFPEWLAATGCGIAFTTYQTGKLITLGVSPSGELSAFQGCFSRPTGLAVGANGRSIVLATEHMIQRFDNIVPAGEIGPDGFDAVFA